jgi:hypothetical protein
VPQLVAFPRCGIEMRNQMRRDATTLNPPNAETLLNADHLKNTDRSLLKPQIGADNSPPETRIGTDDTEKSQMTQMTLISSDEHR